MSINFNSIIHNGTIEHNWEKHHALQPGDVFVEVGGFWGRYGVLATSEGAKVFLVEPGPANRAVIDQVMREYGMTFAVIPKAVAASKGTRKFITSANPSGWRLSQSEADSMNYKDSLVDVETDTLEGILDGLGVDHVDLLACDCEGAEVDLVKYGGRWFHDRLVRNVALGAYHAPDNPRLIIEMLGKEGYKGLVYEDGVVYGTAT